MVFCYSNSKQTWEKNKILEIENPLSVSVTYHAQQKKFHEAEDRVFKNIQAKVKKNLSKKFMKIIINQHYQESQTNPMTICMKKAEQSDILFKLPKKIAKRKI